MRPVSIIVVAILGIVACGSGGGAYVPRDRQSEGVDRGEVNGRMFDFVSNKPEGDDWQIRIRGSSMWVSYSNEAKSDDLGTRNLTPKETDKVWQLIDALELDKRKKGKKDEDEGYVQLRLREPSGEEGTPHEFISVFISRADPPDEVVELAEYLRSLVAKYTKEKPNF